MIKKSELPRWLNWCSRVDRLLLLDRETMLDLVAEHPAASDVLACLERDAIEGERLVLLLEPTEATFAARRMVRWLDRLSVALSQKLVSTAEKCVVPESSERNNGQ